MDGRPSPIGRAEVYDSTSPTLANSLFDLLQTSGKVLGLTRPETLERLGAHRLNQIFQSDQLLVPEWDQSGCVAQQIKDWVAENRPEAVLAVGGDGTLNLLSQVAVQCPVPVVLVPAGTANDFARGLSESHWDQLRWHPADIVQVVQPDGKTNSSFINMLALGCGARHSTVVDRDTKATWGSLAYLVQAWQTLGDLQGFRLKLICDDQEHIFDQAVQLFAANGRTCGGGYSVADSAKFDDGLLDLVVINQGTPMEIASFIQAYLAGTHLEHELSCHIRCEQVRIELDAPQATTLDGEGCELASAELKVLPSQLSIAKMPVAEFY